MLVWAVALTAALGCGRRGRFVEPTGWERDTPAADSLTREIELSFQNGAGPDSTLSLMRRYRRTAVRPGNSREAESRLLYWRGRVEIRRQNRTLGQALFDSAYNAAPGATREYLGRILEWRREDRDDYTEGEWYSRKLDQAAYFESRDDRQMLYNVYRELMELMRDEGLHERALHYLGLLTECNRRIDPAMAELDDKMNRAAILSDMGRDAEAVRLLRELQADTAYMREPVNCQLVNLNIHNLERDTSALHAAWRSISLYGDRADILPKVYFYMEEEAMEARDCMAARRWSDSLAAMLPEFGPGEFRVKSLKGIARAREMCGTAGETAAAYREYALAADSLCALMRGGNVADLEVARVIDEVDRRVDAEKRRSRTVWCAAAAVMAAAVAAGLLLLWRWRRRTRKMRDEALKIRGEAERRQMALQLDADRRGLATEIGSDDFLTLFSQHYPLFISRLREISPRISDTALRLAGYIAIGLSTKEIAELMNVRPESVRQAKWRLRKTLGRDSEEDLYPLLSSLLLS